MTKQVLVGKVTRIDEPFYSRKGKPIQEIALKRSSRVYVYPQVHNNPKLLEGIKVGDTVKINYELYGKERSKEESRLHFHTIVINEIEKIAI